MDSDRFGFGAWRLIGVVVGLLSSTSPAVEVTVQNDSLIKGADSAIQAGFVAGESAAAWLTSPCNGNIVALQVFWRSTAATGGQSLESSITVFDAGSFPFPGTQLEELVGPVMTDGAINEFRHLDENQTVPIIVPVTENQVFIVSFEFANTPPGLGPSVVTDVDGCQPNRNAIFAIPGGWLNACSLGVSGDFVIRAVVDCDPTQACCFSPSGCVDLTPEDCGIASGFPQGVGTSCASTACFPTGACCNPDGSCTPDQSEDDCLAAGGVYQGNNSQCETVECPEPEGACCLANGNCLELMETECENIPGALWDGALTDCDTSCETVPAASDWGLICLALSVLMVGTILVKRRPALI